MRVYEYCIYLGGSKYFQLLQLNFMQSIPTVPPTLAPPFTAKNWERQNCLLPLNKLSFFHVAVCVCVCWRDPREAATTTTETHYKNPVEQDVRTLSLFVGGCDEGGSSFSIFPLIFVLKTFASFPFPIKVSLRNSLSKETGATCVESVYQYSRP